MRPLVANFYVILAPPWTPQPLHLQFKPQFLPIIVPTLPVIVVTRMYSRHGLVWSVLVVVVWWLGPTLLRATLITAIPHWLIVIIPIWNSAEKDVEYLHRVCTCEYLMPYLFHMLKRLFPPGLFWKLFHWAGSMLLLKPPFWPCRHFTKLKNWARLGSLAWSEKCHGSFFGSYYRSKTSNFWYQHGCVACC